MLNLDRGRRFLWKIVDTLTWKVEGTGYNFTRGDVLDMELAEVLFYFRQARRHFEEISEARRKGNSGGSGGSGSTTETHTDGWADTSEADDDADEDEDVSVESLMDD